MTTVAPGNLPPQDSNPNRLTNFVGTIRDLGSIAWHGSRARRFDTKLGDNTKGIANAEHDIDFYDAHAGVVKGVIDYDYDGWNQFSVPVVPDHEKTGANAVLRHFEVPKSKGALGRQTESQARIAHYRANPGSQPVSGLTGGRKPRVEVDASRQPGQPEPRNKQQENEELRIARLVREIRDDRKTQLDRSKVFGTAIARSGRRTARAKREDKKATERAFENGSIDAYEFLDRKADRPIIQAGGRPHPIHKTKHKLDRITQGGRITRDPVERLRGKADSAEEQVTKLEEKRAELIGKQNNHRRKLAAARNRQDARRR